MVYVYHAEFKRMRFRRNRYRKSNLDEFLGDIVAIGTIFLIFGLAMMVVGIAFFQ